MVFLKSYHVVKMVTVLLPIYIVSGRSHDFKETDFIKVSPKPKQIKNDERNSTGCMESRRDET